MKVFQNFLYGCAGAFIMYVFIMLTLCTIPQAKYNFELPEEFDTATSKDTLTLVKDGDEIIIEFKKHKQ